MKILKINNKAQIPIGFVIGLAFFSFSLLYIFSYKYLPDGIRGCKFRKITKIPCPSCGGTRVGYYLIQGKIGKAFLENPLIFFAGIFLSLFSFFSLYSYLKNFQWKIILSKKELKFLRIFIVSFFFLNWIYLILKEIYKFSL